METGKSNAAYPSFSRDGEWIYFAYVEAGESRIWKVRAAGGAAVQVTDNAGTIAVESYDGRDLYYLSSTDRPGSIWRLPLAGGPAVKLVDGIASGAFDVARRGLYYIDRVSGEAGVFFTDRPGGETRLRYFDFATAQSTTIVRDLGAVVFGLSASGDGRTVLFTRIDSSIDEVVLVDNFR